MPFTAAPSILVIEPLALKSHSESTAGPGAYQKMSALPSLVNWPTSGVKVPVTDVLVAVHERSPLVRQIESPPAPGVYQKMSSRLPVSVLSPTKSPVSGMRAAT